MLDNYEKDSNGVVKQINCSIGVGAWRLVGLWAAWNLDRTLWRTCRSRITFPLAIPVQGVGELAGLNRRLELEAKGQNSQSQLKTQSQT